MSRAVLFRAADIAAATGGQLVQGSGETGVCSVTTDSRTPEPDSLFVALRGPSFDGAEYCRAAAGGGSCVVLVERGSWQAGRCGDLPAQLALVVVADALRALGDLAAWHRRRFPVPLVAVTGSNGKTSTKQMVIAVLGAGREVLFNRGNFNNLVGMPRALLGLDAAHRWVVMEMGMNAPGEIARLAEIAGPQVGIITNVHPVHLEGLGSLAAVAEAKGELFAALAGDGLAVVNADDPYVLKQVPRTRARRMTFGTTPVADVRVESVQQQPQALVFRLTAGRETTEVRLPRLGAHHAVNAAAAAAVGLHAGLSLSEVAGRLAGAEQPALRMQPLDLGGRFLLVDCYNANPRSVQVALQTLTALAPAGGRLAVLGDMKELGAASESLHRQTGQTAAALDGLCAFGPLAEAIAAGARDAGLTNVLHCDSVERAADWVLEHLPPGGWALIKGSRSMRLERVVGLIADRLGIEWGSGEGH